MTLPNENGQPPDVLVASMNEINNIKEYEAE
jgi:hypothetical protein